MRTSRVPCWQCGKGLMLKANGELVCNVITLPGGNQVKVHKTCAQSAVDYQKFDRTPGQVINRRSDADE
jgi:hypothetical protein